AYAQRASALAPIAGHRLGGDARRRVIGRGPGCAFATGFRRGLSGTRPDPVFHFYPDHSHRGPARLNAPSAGSRPGPEWPCRYRGNRSTPRPTSLHISPTQQKRPPEFDIIVLNSTNYINITGQPYGDTVYT